MTIVIRVIILMIAALAVFRLVYAIGSSERKEKMRNAVDRLMSMLTMTVVIYWIYMAFIWYMRDKGGE